MTVGNLKKQLIGISDDTVILRPSHDHGYREVVIDLTTAMVYPGCPKNRSHTEDFGDDHNEPGGKRIPALVIT